MRGYLRSPPKKKRAPKGQRRPAPGRPPGIHTPHRSPQERRAYLIERYGCPVEYMLNVMATKGNPVTRKDEMAKAVAPYVAQKLSAVELSGDQDKPIVTRQDLSKLSDAELARHYAAIIAAKREKRK